MPTYEYACRACGQHLEVVQSFRDEALTTCGACGGALRKVFSAAGIIFKGSGYYVTDTRQKSAGVSSTSSSEAKAGKQSDSGDAAAGTSESDSAKPDSAKPDSAKPDSAKRSGQHGTAESA